MHDGKIFEDKGINALGIGATAKAISIAEAEAHSGTICAARTLKAKAGIAESPTRSDCRKAGAKGNAQNNKGIKMKYRGHETFSIRKNWLAKGLEAVAGNVAIFTDKKIEAMDELGIGRNMVFALRYWLKAVGLTSEEKVERQTKTIFTPLGNVIFENDPYVEEIGTLWLLHRVLAMNKDFATSWYFFFNEFNLAEFSKEDFVAALESFDRMNGGSAAHSSFEGDFECLLNTYISRFKTETEADPEDNMDCPFAELGLVDFARSVEGKKIYRKVIPPKQNIPPLIFLAALYGNENGTGVGAGNGEVLLSDIQNKAGGAAKIFNLDVITLMDILGQLENLDLIRIVRTAGLDVIRLNENESYFSCIKKYYAELKK